MREVNPRCVSSDLLYRISSALLHVHFFCEVSSLVVFVYFYFFLNAMEFVPLWFHCHRPNASRWSCWEPDGRWPNQSVRKPNRRASTWRDAILRVLTVWEGKWFRLPLSPHPLLSPTPPQVLTPFNNVQLTDTNSPPLYKLDYCLAHPMDFYFILSWIVGNMVIDPWMELILLLVA